MINHLDQDWYIHCGSCGRVQHYPNFTKEQFIEQIAHDGWISSNEINDDNTDQCQVCYYA